MSNPSRAMIALLAGIAWLGCLGATPGPRGTPPRSEYKAPDVPYLSPEEEELREQYMPRNERFARQREIAQAQAEALEKVTDRESRLPELNAWMRRLDGRFRLGGEVKVWWEGRYLISEVSGVADCAAIGEGPGMQCFFNADWPITDPRKSSRAPFGMIEAPFPTEALRTFNPAVLVLGVDPKLLEVRAMLVTHDTVTHSWAGMVTANKLTAGRVGGCLEAKEGRPEFRCISRLEITAGPDSDMVLRFVGSANIAFTLHPDPDAEPETPMKTKKFR